MCDHRSIECQIGTSPGEMIIKVKCADCGMLPMIESMDILAMQALLAHSEMKQLIDGQVAFNVNIDASLN